MDKINALSGFPKNPFGIKESDELLNGIYRKDGIFYYKDRYNKNSEFIQCKKVEDNEPFDFEDNISYEFIESATLEEGVWSIFKQYNGVYFALKTIRNYRQEGSSSPAHWLVEKRLPGGNWVEDNK